MIAAATDAPWWVIAAIPFLVIAGICYLGALLGQGDCVRSSRRRKSWPKEVEDDEELKAEIAEMRRWEAEQKNP